MKSARHSPAVSPALRGDSLLSFTKKNFVTLPLSAQVGEAIAIVRRSAQRGDLFYLYVVSEERLIGVVSIRNLLLAQDNEALANIVSRKIVFLPSHLSAREAAELFAQSRYLSLPVVDAQQKILGVVHAHELSGETTRDVESLLEERGRTELFELLGIQAQERSLSLTRAAAGRLPWVLVILLGGSLSAYLIHALGGRIHGAVEFLAFVPLLLLLCESIGMQAASLAIGALVKKQPPAAIRAGRHREWAIASLLGLAAAILLSGQAALFGFSSSLVISVGIGIFTGAVWASWLGSHLPIFIHRLKVDPSIAVGPLVLAVADSSTLLLFLLISIAVSRLLN